MCCNYIYEVSAYIERSNKKHEAEVLGKDLDETGWYYVSILYFLPKVTKFITEKLDEMV